MKVWIDRNQCTSSGLCEVIAPDTFVVADDGLAHLTAEDPGDPGGPDIVYTVPAEYEDTIREAAEQCPGECIYIEP